MGMENMETQSLLRYSNSKNNCKKNSVFTYAGQLLLIDRTATLFSKAIFTSCIKKTEVNSTASNRDTKIP